MELTDNGKVGDGTDKGSGVGKEVGNKQVERSREG
jgi:hypothetical protein